jgi:hypothetical protein
MDELRVNFHSNENRILVGIPTRDRPEYLCGLLATLINQTTCHFDVLIIDSGEISIEHHSHFIRFRSLLEVQCRKVMVETLEVVGRSEVLAVNRILTKAFEDNYGFVFKVDDDHILPPNALDELCNNVSTLEVKNPVIVSGVTPWMFRVWEGAAGPEDIVKTSKFSGKLVSRVEIVNDEVNVIIGHYNRFEGVTPLMGTEIASAANFMMRPDCRLLWTDTCGSSLYADAVWFLQLEEFLGYRMWFNTGVNVWHAACPSGGVRDKTGEYVKNSIEDESRRKYFNAFVKSLGSKGGK